MIKYKLFVDGACSGNPGPGGAGVVVIGPDEVEVASKGFNLGPDFTNNKAEYSALIRGLELLKELNCKIDILEIFSDSKLVVEQIRGNYEVRNEELQILYEAALQLLESIPVYEIIFIPRKYNRQADALARASVRG